MATLSVFVQALESIRDRIQDLNLPGLPDNRVRMRRLPHDGEHYFPGITVHPVTEKYHDGTNMRESVGYGCAVTMVVNNENDQDYLLDRLLFWREVIRRNFVEKAGLPEVTLQPSCTVKVEHGHVINSQTLYDKNVDVSDLILRVYVLETRGTLLSDDEAILDETGALILAG